MHSCRSHKGSALALLVELLAGAAVGAAVEDKMSEKNWGNLVVAVDPALLGDVSIFQVPGSSIHRQSSVLVLLQLRRQGLVPG